MRCLWCHKDVDEAWTACPDCGGELEPDLTTGAAAPTYRPAGAKPFDPLVIVSVRRMTASGPLVVLGANGRIEANLVPAGDAVMCHDIEGPELFSLKRYQPVTGAVVAFTGDDEPLATFLPDGAGLTVRDGTSAPVAALQRQRGSTDNFDLVETGGEGRLASVWRQDCELGNAIDDEWTLLPTDDHKAHAPVGALALVALLVVSAARFAAPPRVRADQTYVTRSALLDLLS